MTTSLRVFRIRLVTWVLLLVAVGSLAASERPKRVARATAVVDVWSSDQHLFVKGNLPVPAARLVELEQWLDRNGKNWTVVILENARGETYRDVDGRDYRRMDAVELALGKGLDNKTGFSKFVDARTREKNGVLFVLYLAERKFSYYGSDAFDRRNLGEKAWKGNLDKPAIAAMRGGGRIVDAVKDTVTSVERRLTQALAAAQNQRERAAADAVLRTNRALAKIQVLKEKIDLADTKTGDLLERLEDAPTGSLAEPEIPRWRVDLANLERSALAGDRSAQLSARTTELEDEIDTHLRALEAHRLADRKITDLEKRVDSASVHPLSSDGNVILGDARRAVAEAREAYQRADPAFQSWITKSEEMLSSLERANGIGRGAQRELREKTEARNQALGVGGAGGAVGTLALGIFANRRRRKAKAEAEDLCRNWQAGLREKADGLFELLDRATVVVGSASDVDERGYSGETLRLSKQAIKDVDELFIMSSCADRILDESEGLVFPGNPFGKFVNAFSKHRYRRARRLLQEEPIRFRPEEQLEFIVRGRRADRESLLGSRETYEPFAMSFEQLIGAFNERAERALFSLDLVESSWFEISGALEGLQSGINQAVAKEDAVNRAASEDGYFLLDGLFEKLIPSAQADYDQAVALGSTDPVDALRTSIPSGSSKIEDALGIAGTVLDFRGERLPAIRETATALEEKEYHMGWVGAALQTFSTDADALCAMAVEEGIDEQRAAFREDLFAFADRVDLAKAAAERSEIAERQAIAQATERVKAARETLAGALSVGKKAILHEGAHDPDVFLKNAHDEVLAARNAINRGAIDEAMIDLEEVDALVFDVHQIVDATESAHEAFPEKLAARKEDTARIAKVYPGHAAILEDLRARYAPSALRIAAADPGYPDPETTIEEHASQIEQGITECRDGQKKANALFKKGSLLGADTLLENAAALQEEADAWLEEIVSQQQRLAATEAENLKGIENWVEHARATRETLLDPKVCQSTIDAFAGGVQDLELAEEGVAPRHGHSDPFAAGEALAEAATAFREVDSLILANRDAFAEATRSLRSAEAQLRQTVELVRRAAADQVPDSATIAQATTETAQLEEDYREAAQMLAVPHYDWIDLDEEADRIDAEAARNAATLREELQRAEACVEALRDAARAVRRATGWTGSFGIRIPGSPGADLIESARHHLLNGDYPSTHNTATQARRVAENAIAEAAALVARRQREEHERQEAERRARAASRRRRRARMNSSFGTSSRSRGGGGGFGSSSSSGSFGGRSSGGMSGGSSSSSSSPSGSGFGRSGW